MHRLKDPKGTAIVKRLPVNGVLKSRRKVWQTLIAMFSTIAFSALAGGQTTSQPTSGIYLTAADYENHRLTTGDGPTSEATPVKLRLTGREIEVTRGSKSKRFAKDKLFGFRSNDGRDYRLASNREYEIMEAKELYIYAQTPEQTLPRGRENPVAQSERKYFFSLGAAGKIRDLTLANLKQAIPNNHRFHDLLDQSFGQGHNVAEYDDFHKMYKVNRVLIASRE